MNGRLTAAAQAALHAGRRACTRPIEIGVRRPVPTPVAELGPGEVGYLIAGIKDVGEARSGETVTDGGARRGRRRCPATAIPSRWCSPGSSRSTATTSRTSATRCEKLKLNDASITYTPETSGALGFGFRCGFLGLLHMEIVKERLEREFGLALIATAPERRVPRPPHRRRRSTSSTTPPTCPTRSASTTSRSRTSRSASSRRRTYTGTLMELCQQRRGELDKIEYLSPERVELHYVIPLAEVVVDFFDQLKSRSQGYASLDYEPAGYRRSNLVKVDLLLNGVPADAFSTIVHRDKAYDYGKQMAEKLQQLIPRQMFDVPIQAAIGGKVIARETVKAKRKDVLAKCYGGDITRKRKLLEKQKEGKKKMKSIGRVEVPGDVFISALKLD